MGPRSKHDKGLDDAQNACMATRIDLPPACAAFVAVAREQSFTEAAASIGVAQPVVSRRVAALEQVLGGALLERSARRVVLTGLGRRVLPAAAEVARAVEDLLDAADRYRDRVVILSLPDVLDLSVVAELGAACETAGVAVAVRHDGPGERGRLLETDVAQVAVVAVPQDVADWSSPLGVAGGASSDAPFPLSALRTGRWSDGPAPTLWGTDEDDVAHVRDALERARDLHGLARSQVRWDNTLAGLQRTLSGRDHLLATRADARRYRLPWRPLADVALHRGHVLRAHPDSVAVLDVLRPLVGAVLHPDAATRGAAS